MISYASSKTFLNFVIDEGTGIFLTRNSDTYTQGYIQISNNLSAYNGASGIVCHKTNRTIIEHNTTYKNGTTNDSAAGGIGINTVDDVTIKNNISYAEPDHWALGTLAQPNTNVIIANNLLYNENGSQQIYNNLPNGWIENNPLLVNPELGDFTITSNSPAKNTGTTTSIIIDDYMGTLRNDGNPDIGAYEYSGSLSAEDLESLNFSIYPNPTTSFVIINSKNEINNLQIFNTLGQELIIEKQFLSNNQIKLNLNTISKGLYFIKLNNSSKAIVKN
jgi:hypothetical protein